MTAACGCRGAGGRHAFIFMRHVNTWGYLGLQIFCGLPFIYELRAVLDWSCTPTTLKLFDWLKLEDISTSLYFVTCDRYGREGRQLGQRQPRYMKFCQVAPCRFELAPSLVAMQCISTPSICASSSGLCVASSY